LRTIDIFWAYVVLLLGACGVGGGIFRQGRNRGMPERLVAALLPVWMVVIAWDWLATLGFLPVISSGGTARGELSLGLRYRYQLDSPPHSGPALGGILPPIATLAYKPATLLQDATAAALVGRCLSLVSYFVPAAWILGGGMDRHASPRWVRWLLLATFALLTHHFEALRSCSTEIHADAPALGLAALAVGVMARSRDADDTWRRGLALILATLSVWTKQLTTPILIIVLPVWALATGGLRGVFQLVVGACVVSLALILLFLGLSDTSSEIFNVLTIPSRYFWRIEPLANDLNTLVALENKYLLLMFLLATAALGMAAVRPWREEQGGGLWAEPWTLFLLVGLAELPLPLLGCIKAGGADNSLVYSISFLTLASLLMIGRLMATDRRADGAAGERATWLAVGLVGLDSVLAFLSAQQSSIALTP
jgi:hypothetical protein